MKSLHHLGPSPEHAEYASLLPEYWQRTQQQEDALVKAGLPAHGLKEFAKRWFDAWAHQSIEELRACMTEDCSFIDSSSFQHTRYGREETLANCAATFEAFPDQVFYPQDHSLRSLVYADYAEEQWRVVIPWRAIARWTGPVRIPGTKIALPPTGQCLNFIGVDRYTLTEDWRITHIDTDWNMLIMAIQGSAVPVPSPPLAAMRAISLAARVTTPFVRFLGRPSPTKGHRRFDLPLPRVVSADQWADGAEAANDAVLQFRKKGTAA